MLRVIAGKAKGQKLSVPEIAQPISDRLKTKLFDTIGDEIVDSKVLDLFAGSGAIGIEALSRGASLAMFVESDLQAAEILKQNLASLKSIGRNKYQIEVEEVIDALKFIRPERFDYIFADPPFAGLNKELIDKLIQKISDIQTLILKLPKDYELSLPERAELIWQKSVANTSISAIICYN